MRAISGVRFSFDQLLLAAVLDQLRIANWYHTKDAKRRKNFPESILNELLRKPEDKKTEKDEIETFESGADLMRRLNEIRGENNASERN